jgi:pimeloyl-ACP methyl ester carboxylesterase
VTLSIDPRNGRRSTIAADDGTLIAVQQYGGRWAPVTVVFLHGFSLCMDSWESQRAALHERWGSEVQMLFVDHRGHGRSGTGSPDNLTIEQLGRDLDAVLRGLPDSTRIVLVGHSMGAMAIMSWARQHPDFVGSRVAGVAIVASAAYGVADKGIGVLLRLPVAHVLRIAAQRVPQLVDGARTALHPVLQGILRLTGYGFAGAPADQVAATAAMIRDTSTMTIAEFLDELRRHNETEALPVLARIPSVVLCGSADRITPYGHSVRIARELPLAELERVRGAGHMVIQEQPQVVAEALDHLLARAAEYVVAVEQFEVSV